MALEKPFPSPFVGKRSNSPRFANSISRRVFSDVVGDIIIDVDRRSFLLHKFPLVCRCGKIRKMVANSQDSDTSNLMLINVPGGPQAFELAVKFCYGTNFEITPTNVAQLYCIAVYLEMTEDYKEDNLFARVDAFLNDVVVQSLERSVEVLCACEHLLPVANDMGIVNRCANAVAMNASKEQLVSGLARLESSRGSGKVKMDYQDWWVEDLSLLRIDMYQRVICAMRQSGVRSDSITASLIHYAQNSLKGIGTHQSLDSGIPDEQKKLVETLVCLLVSEKIASVPLIFLFGMLRMAIVVDAAMPCRLELERRIGFQLDMVSLDDILIPSLHSGDLLFDVDTVHRMLANFLEGIEENEHDESFHNEFEPEPPGSPMHRSILKVGNLIDGYLAEIAADQNLNLHKFMAFIELLPDYARVIEDGLYRAIDIYLKAHPSLTDCEIKKLCKLIDCEKLSQEASTHAAQNERLPVQMMVRVLYLEQLRLKSSLASDSGEGFFSQRMLSGSGVPSTAVSPRDNYASLRRENRELKLEISRMRVRLSDLEKEQEFMKQGMKDGKSTDHGGAFLGALSRGFGRIGLFGPGSSGHQNKCTKKSHQSSSEAKKRRQQIRSSS